MFFIIAIVIFAISYSIFKDFKKEKGKENQKECNEIHIDSIKHFKTIQQNTEISQRAYQRRKRIEARGERLERHRRIWAILFLSNSLYEIEERMKNGFPTKKMLQDLENAKRAVLENRPTRVDIYIAIRFCQIEYNRGKCSRKLSNSDIETIRNIHTIAQMPPYTP